jgi:hypothetical protein
MRFEFDIELSGHNYLYALLLELPEGFDNLRVKEEKLSIDGKHMFERDVEKIYLYGRSREESENFRFNWHSIFFSSFQPRNNEKESELIEKLKKWLAEMLIIAPVPRNMTQVSTGGTVVLQMDCSNIANWFANILERSADSYSDAKNNYLKVIFPDFDGLSIIPNEYGAKILKARFKQSGKTFDVSFDKLADGEKCLILATLVIAANQLDGSEVFCFWDEPDNYLALSEIEHFIAIIKKSFGQVGQLFMSSHNPETFARFSEDNTFIFFRKDHLSPTQKETVEDFRKRTGFSGDFADALRGEWSE